MSYVAVIADSHVTIRDVVDVGNGCERPRLRFQPLASGDLGIMSQHDGHVDGRAMLGGLAVVQWGCGAIVRAPDRIEVRWVAARELRTAPTARRCALCLGPIAGGDAMSVCVCEVAVHPACHAVMISCSSCGEAA